MGDVVSKKRRPQDYYALVAQLQPLERIDTRVFNGDETCPQHVCDFVLSLALAFNDLRDLLIAERLLRSTGTEDKRATVERGQFGGAQVHLFRLLAGFLHELVDLIRKERKSPCHPFFKSLLSEIPTPAVSMWRTVVDTAFASGPHGNDFGRFLFDTRNTVAFHYDSKVIGRGFRARFEDREGPPFASIGSSMAETRFYFGDAAAQEVMWQKAGADSVDEFLKDRWEILNPVSHALREIVTHFIRMRSSSKQNPESQA